MSVTPLVHVHVLVNFQTFSTLAFQRDLVRQSNDRPSFNSNVIESWFVSTMQPGKSCNHPQRLPLPFQSPRRDSMRGCVRPSVSPHVCNAFRPSRSDICRVNGLVRGILESLYEFVRPLVSWSVRVPRFRETGRIHTKQSYNDAFILSIQTMHQADLMGLMFKWGKNF